MVIAGPARALFRVFAASKVKQGWGAGRIYRATKGTAMGVQKQWGLAQVREFSGLFKWEKAVAAIPHDQFVPRYAMVEVKFTRDRRYRFFGTMGFTDLDTGEEKTRNVSFYSDRMMDEDEIGEDYKAKAEKTKCDVYLPQETFFLRSVEHNSRMGY